MVQAIERETGLTRQAKVIDAQCRQLLDRFRVRRAWTTRRRCQFRQTVRDEQDQVDEQSIGGSFDLKVSEQAVGSEEVEGFFDDVRLGWVLWEQDKKGITSAKHPHDLHLSQCKRSDLTSNRCWTPDLGVYR